MGREEPVSWARKGGRDRIPFSPRLFSFLSQRALVSQSTDVIIVDPHFAPPLRPTFTLPTYGQGEEDPEVLYSI